MGDATPSLVIILPSLMVIGLSVYLFCDGSVTILSNINDNFFNENT